jgi:hypothetical protein
MEQAIGVTRGMIRGPENQRQSNNQREIKRGSRRISLPSRLADRTTEIDATREGRFYAQISFACGGMT